ncbi:MAG: LysR family transcriptional regulator, partial [Sneathiellales bacterium]|nr:LysR family transcriptional regulator [Sneathiellales bacterium]
MTSIESLKLFVHVVEEGSFSSAARLFGCTPSSVSRQISNLEEELGTRLFQRTTRKQQLTEAGEIYFQHAQRITFDVEQARTAVQRLTEKPSGVLKVTAEADFAVSFIAPVLPVFLARFPDIKIRLFTNSNRIDVVDNAMDLAIRFGELPDSQLIARKITSSRSLLCASPEYLEKHGMPENPQALEAHNCLSFRVGSEKNTWDFAKDANRLSVPISGSISANSLNFLRVSALSHQGIIMIPNWIVREDLKAG